MSATQNVVCLPTAVWMRRVSKFIRVRIVGGVERAVWKYIFDGLSEDEYKHYLLSLLALKSFVLD